MTSPVVCLYMGPAHECSECGGYSADGRFCSDECADNEAGRLTVMQRQEDARRHADEVFGRAVDRLRAMGFTYEECDQLLQGLA